MLEIRINATVKVLGSCEFNCDGFKHCVLENCAPLAIRDSFMNLPRISASDNLEPFEIDGEVLMNGDIRIVVLADNWLSTFKILDTIARFAIHFCFVPISVNIGTDFGI